MCFFNIYEHGGHLVQCNRRPYEVKIHQVVSDKTKFKFND